MPPSCSSELLGYISAIQPQQGLLQKWLEGQRKGEVSHSPGQEQNTALPQPDLCGESMSRAGRGCLPPPCRKATFVLLGSLQWDLRPLCLGRMRGELPNGSSEGSPVTLLAAIAAPAPAEAEILEEAEGLRSRVEAVCREALSLSL